MSIARHEVTISREQLDLVLTGHLVTTRSNKDLRVQFVRDDLYDQTPGGNGIQLIPVGDGLIRDLGKHGGTGWLPHNSPYTFGIYLEN